MSTESPLARHGADGVDVPHRPDDRGSAEPKRRKPRDRPLVIVLTGTGKGKCTSAFGMLMRSWARGYRCGVFQFVKSGKWKVGEAKAAAALGGIDWEKMGDGWSWLSKDLDESADMAREGWARGQAGRSRRSATSSCCSTRSPTRSSGAGSTPTRSLRRCATVPASSTS